MLDEGLRQFMLAVYSNMGIGLIITAIVGAAIGLDENLIKLFMGGPQAWIFMLAPLGLVWYISAKIDSMEPSTARSLFWVYSAIMGISLSTIFAVFTLGSIVQVFLVTAATFGAMSIYGHTTRTDLTKLGSFLIMGLIGIIIASIANLFFQSNVASFAISVISVLVFTLLTAYDTQKLKEIYYHTQGDDQARAGVMGALSLYLDFINIFIHLLNIMGNRR
jgi:FtsH-binding integral membrane protein